MPLENFGSILNFAEELESQDQEFYEALAGNPACGDHKQLFEQFAADAQKNVKTVQRTRRENVTEMILEPIRDFVRDSYQLQVDIAASLDSAAMLTASAALENRAIRYYGDAAEKMRALPEVSRALKTLAKKRTQRLGQIENLSA